MGINFGRGRGCMAGRGEEGGVFIFNIEHPVFTAGVGQDWIYTEAGTPRYWPVDNYFIPGMKGELRRPMMLLVIAIARK